MRSTKSAPVASPDLTPADRIRALLAFSLCVDVVRDDDLLTLWPSIDLVEAVVLAERDLGIQEIDDEKLMKCRTIGDLVKVIL